MKRLKKLICRLFGHKLVTTQISYYQREGGDRNWSKVTTEGPRSCKRCLFFDGPIEINLRGDFCQIEVILDDGSAAPIAWADMLVNVVQSIPNATTLSRR